LSKEAGEEDRGEEMEVEEDEELPDGDGERLQLDEEEGDESLPVLDPSHRPGATYLPTGLHAGVVGVVEVAMKARFLLTRERGILVWKRCKDVKSDGIVLLSK
jgi:hypothetical protein